MRFRQKNAVETDRGRLSRLRISLPDRPPLVVPYLIPGVSRDPVTLNFTISCEECASHIERIPEEDFKPTYCPNCNREVFFPSNWTDKELLFYIESEEELNRQIHNRSPIDDDGEDDDNYVDSGDGIDYISIDEDSSGDGGDNDSNGTY